MYLWGSNREKGREKERDREREKERGRQIEGKRQSEKVVWFTRFCIHISTNKEAQEGRDEWNDHAFTSSCASWYVSLPCEEGLWWWNTLASPTSASVLIWSSTGRRHGFNRVPVDPLLPPSPGIFRCCQCQAEKKVRMTSTEHVQPVQRACVKERTRILWAGSSISPLFYFHWQEAAIWDIFRPSF